MQPEIWLIYQYLTNVALTGNLADSSRTLRFVQNQTEILFSLFLYIIMAID